MIKRSPFRYFKTSLEIIRLAVMLYVRYPLSLRNVEDLLHERGIEISHVRWSGFLGQVCGLAKMLLICIHAAFRISAWVEYAVSGVRLSRALRVVDADPSIDCKVTCTAPPSILFNGLG